LIIHFHESKTFGLTRVFILNKADTSHFSMFSEQSLELILCYIVRQVTYIDIHSLFS